MKKNAFLLLGTAGLGAQAEGRYSTPPAVQLSPDLASPWILQLKQNQPQPAKSRTFGHTKRSSGIIKRKPAKPNYAVIANHKQEPTGIFAGWGKKKKPQTYNQKPKKKLRYVRARPAPKAQSQARPKIDPRFLPQVVSYQSSQKPGTIIIDTNTRHLYLVLGNGKARRYGVGVGKQGFEWSGTERITRKAEWPSWTPPKEMIVRERKKGRELPAFMPGGPANPMGARALYLGSTLYRIHGTNQPWTIGQAVSSGCIRMRNQDVIDLYERARQGAKVIVS